MPSNQIEVKLNPIMTRSRALRRVFAELFSVECRKTKTNVRTHRTQTIQWTNKKSYSIQAVITGLNITARFNITADWMEKMRKFFKPTV